MFDEIKDFKLPAMNIKVGSFARLSKKSVISNWVYCRESFHNDSTSMNQLLFCHSKDKGKNIACFINELEDRLKHKNKTVCGPTKFNKVMWINPSSFWKKQTLRRSLFTALLRAGQKYNPAINNFETALFSHEYIRQTRNAVEWFLKGNTWYSKNDSNNQWKSTFVGLSTEEVKKLLSKKPVKKESLFQFAIDKLGMCYESLEDEYRNTFFTHKSKELKTTIPKLKVIG